MQSFLNQSTGWSSIIRSIRSQCTILPLNLSTFSSWIVFQLAIWGFPSGSLPIGITSALAEHPHDVHQLEAREQHYKALLAYQKLPQRQQTAESTLAGARSAWALSLPEEATKLFQQALKSSALTAREKEQALASLGIIALQEKNYGAAREGGDQLIALAKRTPTMKSAAGLGYFLHGSEALVRGDCETAVAALTQSLAALEEQYVLEAHLSLATCLERQGNLIEARSHLEQIPLNHSLTPVAIRGLARIAATIHEFDRARFWIQKGRAEYPESFTDSWNDYVLFKDTASRNKPEEVLALVDDVTARFPPSDGWLALLEADTEIFFAKPAVNAAPEAVELKDSK